MVKNKTIFSRQINNCRSIKHLKNLSKMKKKIIVFSLSLIALLAVLSITVSCDWFNINLFNKTEVPTTDTVFVEKPEMAITEQTTIEEMLQFREVLKEDRKIDSIFLAMPDIALTGVLIRLGTNVSTKTIVKEYLDNIQYYNNLQLGAAINNAIKDMNISPNYIITDSFKTYKIPKIE